MDTPENGGNKEAFNNTASMDAFNKTTKDEKSVENRQPLSQTLKPGLDSFINNASIVGLQYVGDSSKGWVKRLLWLLLILFGVGASSYHIADRVMYYLRYPSSVAVRVKFSDALLFPVVTICSHNMFSKRQNRKSW